MKGFAIICLEISAIMLEFADGLRLQPRTGRASSNSSTDRLRIGSVRIDTLKNDKKASLMRQ
jgi:hypothetical protein